MIERCPYCGKRHETGDAIYFDTPIKMCPEVPENMIVPYNKEPVTVYGPQGERFESYRYVLAGLEKRA